MWPLFIGLQVVKTILLMLFLPSIIGSVGKIVGKGLPSLSGSFSHPAETVDDLEFKDNSLNSDHDSAGGANYNAYQYNIPGMLKCFKKSEFNFKKIVIINFLKYFRTKQQPKLRFTNV